LAEAIGVIGPQDAAGAGDVPGSPDAAGTATVPGAHEAAGDAPGADSAALGGALMTGAMLGATEGTAVGASVGSALGAVDGTAVGARVGSALGAVDGTVVLATLEGATDGDNDGMPDALADASTDGATEPDAAVDGSTDASADGTTDAAGEADAAAEAPAEGDGAAVGTGRGVLGVRSPPDPSRNPPTMINAKAATMMPTHHLDTGSSTQGSSSVGSPVAAAWGCGVRMLDVAPFLRAAAAALVAPAAAMAVSVVLTPEPAGSMAPSSIAASSAQSGSGMRSDSGRTPGVSSFGFAEPGVPASVVGSAPWSHPSWSSCGSPPQQGDARDGARQLDGAYRGTQPTPIEPLDRPSLLGQAGRPCHQIRVQSVALGPQRGEGGGHALDRALRGLEVAPEGRLLALEPRRRSAQPLAATSRDHSHRHGRDHRQDGDRRGQDGEQGCGLGRHDGR